MAKNYKKQGDITLFDRENKLDMLSKLGNPLERLAGVMDFEMFRPELELLMSRPLKSDAGASAYDPVLMFKGLIIQKFYNLSDEDLEYQIIDRTSFRKFLGLSDGDKVPDARTFWNFKNVLSQKYGAERLFAELRDYLLEKGLIFNEGQMIDASFVEAPRQRNTRDENKTIKEGNGNRLWNGEPNKKCHKDTDARWSIKNKERHYGYKNNVKVDAKGKFINTYIVTSASPHDSQQLKGLITDEDNGQKLWADSAYGGFTSFLRRHHIKIRICDKGVRGKPLSEKLKRRNHRRSKTRSRVEHVFGFMEGTMKRLTVKCIGMVRAKFSIGLTNIVYNMFRYEQIVRLGVN